MKILIRQMVLLISCCWFCTAASLVFFMRFFIRLFFRIQGGCGYQEDKFSLLSRKKLRDLELVPAAPEFKEKDHEKKETLHFDFKFRFLITDDVMKRKYEPEFSMEKSNSPFMRTNIGKYQLLSEKDLCEFMKEPEALTYCAQELYDHSREDHLDYIGKSDRVLKTKFLSAKNFRPFAIPGEEVPNNTSINNVFNLEKKTVESKSASVVSLKDWHSTKGWLLNSLITLDAEEDEVCSLSMKEFYESDTDSQTTSVGGCHAAKDFIIESDSGGFLSKGDFGGYLHDPETTRSATMVFNEVKEDFLEEPQKPGETHLQNSILISRDLNRESLNLLRDIEKYEGVHLKNLCNSSIQPLDSTGRSPRKSCSFDKHEGEIDRFLEEDMVENQLQNSELAIPKFENYSFLCNSSISSLNHMSGVWPQMVAQETTAELLNGEETELPSNCKLEEAQLPKSINFEKGSDHVSINWLPLFKHNSFREPHLNAKDLDEEEAADTGKSKDFHKHIPQNLNCLSAPTIGSLRSGTNHFGKLARASDNITGKEMEPQKCLQKSKETHSNRSSDLDMEDSNEFESLWEHQDLIEQLEMELKKVRAFGLPTILEESESPKMIEDLKPWKIDAKFLHEDPIDELHKVYKSYRERMRKFDILNYQKMYAMGFLQLKDPLQLMSTQKPLIPSVTSLSFQNLWPTRRRKSNSDPSEEIFKDLQSDLELVYVGQSCLSWEFLRWQYEKAQGLSESDPYGSLQYSEVAGEFQQFQVVMQRFLENEPFIGTRVTNYVKIRCVLRNILQVPVIKEDCLEDEMSEITKGNDAITIQVLDDIMEESIMLFWEFVKADKNETQMILRGLAGSRADYQDPMDIEFMVDVEANLQKKEKKLKDLMRTGNWLVRKFKKPREERLNKDFLFCLVDLKLVSRVLKMSRLTTDQLVWCHEKLSKISFVEKKLHREPSFLPFPC